MGGHSNRVASQFVVSFSFFCGIYFPQVAEWRNISHPASTAKIPL